MRIGFYNPYFDGLGGGERYTLVLASHWSTSHDVVLFWDDTEIINSAQKRFGIDLSRVKVVQNIFRGKNVLQKIALSRRYDLIFFLSDGSVPTSFARRNILHFQVPFEKVDANPFKMMRYQAIVCNSLFTKEHLDERVSKRAQVIYPPVPVDNRTPRKKERLILSVGRFSEAKKQNVLIDTFREGHARGVLHGWKLVLAGGLLDTDNAYFNALKLKATKLPVMFLPNISERQLIPIYGRASTYWHATGFGETDPKRMEHFGISTVEAMAAGCVPIVYDGGGLPEIIEHDSSGLLWNSIDELLTLTAGIINDQPRAKIIARQAKERSHVFNEKAFCSAFDSLLLQISF